MNRISYVVNNTDLLKLAGLLFPLEVAEANMNDSFDSLTSFAENLSAKKFFAEAAIPKEEMILWLACLISNGS